MQTVSLAAPVLLAACAGIYWTARLRPEPRLAFARATALLSILCVWMWLWWRTPIDAFPAPLWRELSFLPAAFGLTYWTAVETRRALQGRSR